MIINSKIKNTSDAIDYLNRAVFGEDPETSVLTRVYEGVTPIQDRITAVENSAALVDVQALKDKVDELSNLTEIFANLAYPMPNLVSNGDLTIPDSNPNIPQGFSYLLATDTTLVNNIAKFKATASYGRLQSGNLVYNDGDVIYRFAMVKADSPLVALTNNYSNTRVYHSGNGQWQFLSVMQTDTQSVKVITVRDERTSNWTPIEVDYVGAFNVSQMMLKGVKDDNGTPFTLLTSAQIKTQLDLWMQTRFPLDVLLMMRS